MTKDNLNTTIFNPSNAAFILDPTKVVLSHGRSMQAETNMTAHSHPRGQLLWAEKGVLRITTDTSVSVVAPTHAIWIPGEQQHQVCSETHSIIHNLFIDPSYPIRQQDKQVVMLSMTALMREVILTLSNQANALSDERTNHLALVAIDELETLSPFNNVIHAGKDPRLQKIISHIVQNPNQIVGLPVLSELAGASVRTIERLFKAETGMTFRQWRSRFRLMIALVHFAQGKNSTTVAHELGYKSVSSFIATFKAHFGYTPQAFVEKK